MFPFKQTKEKMISLAYDLPSTLRHGDRSKTVTISIIFVHLKQLLFITKFTFSPFSALKPLSVRAIIFDRISMNFMRKLKF